MLWDMLRYHNYDIRSPYNRDAALWVAQQQSFRFPTDDRPLRDLRAALGRVPAEAEGSSSFSVGDRSNRPGHEGGKRKTLDRVRNFAQRYGRVFSGGAELESQPPSPAPSLPANSELRDLVAAQAAATAPEAVTSTDEPIFVLEPDAPDDVRPAAAAADGPTSQPLFARPPREREASPPPSVETVDVAAEVRRLMAGRGPAGSPSDEIVFIE
jgi:hypothetical protein